MKTGKCRGYRKVKRGLDLALTLAAFVLLFPWMMLIGILIWITSGRPVIYRHPRVGRGGEAFVLYKFRTMVADPKEQERRLTDEQKQKLCQDFKLKQDPRITRFGHFLRKTSLDEIPQLVNVIRGDMSLVGPRPVTEAEIRKYRPHQQLFLSVRPGVTGPWQISGRSDTSYKHRVWMDIHYIRNINFWTDVSILFRTLLVPFRQKGAY